MSMYHNIQGGPTKDTETCWFYKNIGNSYYAERTGLLNSTATEIGTNNTPDARLYFGSGKRIYFLSAILGDTLEFKAVMKTMDVTKYSRAYITIGA